MTLPQYSLLVDTSTEKGIIGLFHDSKGLVKTVELPFGYHNSRSLIPLLAELFKQENVSTEQLKYVAVGIGPGSYTGIRVGVVVAKLIAFTRKIPLIGVCSLSGFIPHQNGRFAAIVDAKIGGVYLQIGEKQNESINLDPPEVCPIQELEAKLNDAQTLVSPFFGILKSKILTLFPHANWLWEERSPDASHMGVIAQSKFQQNDYSLDGHLDLLYLRKTQAEIEKLNKKLLT